MATMETRRQPDLAQWAKQGAIGGVIAGLVFAMFEMLMAAILSGNFWGPLRMIGAIALGEEALSGGYSLATAAITGVIVHMILSVIFGVVFATIVAYVPTLAANTGLLLAAASAYGLALWLINFYLIANAAGWTWFPEETNPLVQFVAHTFLFGTVLGFFLDRATPRRHAS